jgi:hypothetical protein
MLSAAFGPDELSDGRVWRPARAVEEAGDGRQRPRMSGDDYRFDGVSENDRQ